MASAFYPRHTDTDVVSSPNLPKLEENILEYWKTDGTFQASIDNRPAGENGENEYVFYDGPPFANGLPHYGHLLTGYVKDVIPRFRTMTGSRVERRFGWDTHGLPAELEAERILGIKDKSEIEEMGIAAFNEACRESVLKYTKEWEEYVTRQARWVDFDNDYKTLDPSYMESVIWAFKQLYDKGLAYEGYRVLPYCWRDETPLSNHELRMDDDVYQMRQDPSVTVGVRLDSGELLLIWTTTPWTLPSNLAVAVGPDIDYVTVQPSVGDFAGEKIILAEARLDAYARELGGEEGRKGKDGTPAPDVLARFKGSELAGRSYAPPFPYFTGHENAHQVLVDDFVSTEDGTGIVHMAPAFGEEDMEICAKAGIEAVVPVDSAGLFTSEVPDYAGQQVFDANRNITADLRHGTGPLAQVDEADRAVLLRAETYDHSYPHCWRCRNPLIYKAVSSWFVRVSEFRDRMVELNEQITWVPEHIKHGQFGKWLENARDWSISRNRYWGTPIPVWVSDNPECPRTEVYGSFAELEEAFGVEVTDLHRPYIDELVRPNPDDPTGKSMMRRIPDVLDVWFDSGSMPFAQVHYPFENADWFEHHYPGDFIVEYVGQTRGWFYTLHILATALFDRPAFRTCVSHGIVLGDDGRKASKSLRNYPDPAEMWDKYGSDAVRLSLMSSPVLRGGNLIVAEEAIREQVRGVLLPLWNTYYFFSIYANSVGGGSAEGAAGYQARAVEPHEVANLAAMDRYILARTRDLTEQVRAEMEVYDVPAAAHLIRDHLDVLTNWYVRTSRNRFWDEDEGAYNTLYTALETLARVAAPLAPLVTEEVWRGLTGERSVHLTDWPSLPEEFADEELVAAMDAVRSVVSAAHGLRKAHQLRVRQPLRSLRVATHHPAALAPFTKLIAEEVNLLDVELLDMANVSATDYGVHDKLTVNARAAGPRLGKDVQRAIQATRTGDWSIDDGVVTAGGITLQEGEYTLTTEVDASAGEDIAATTLDGGFLVLDLALDDELLAAGYARDIVRQVQDARKEADLVITDRIVLTLSVPADKVAWAQEHSDFIAAETLASTIEITEGEGADVGVSLTVA